MLASSSQRRGGSIARSGLGLALLVLPCGMCRAIDGLKLFEPPPPDERFQALPRPIHYETPLAPADGPEAVIVYGRDATWTQAAASEVQAAVREWAGVELPMADDRTVTSDETWMLTETYRHTPLILLGNTRVNRVLHALGTRYLACSNTMWPGGDRYVVRTVFEPFVADVNFITLEASTPEGLTQAVTRFRGLLASPAAGPSATVPHTIVAGGDRDEWQPPPQEFWAPPTDYADLSGTVAEIAEETRDKPFPGGLLDVAMAACNGGFFGETPGLSAGPESARAVAAKIMNDSRAWGMRTHRPFDHYGAMWNIAALRCVIAAGALTPEELNEAENWMTLSAADPHEYYYDEIGAYDHRMNHDGGRHFASTLWITVNLTDYVANHCRLSDETRAEVERRADGARKTTAEYVRSFRDNMDTWELGESTMLEFYAMLHQGMPQSIANGNLRRMADMFVSTSDNLTTASCWRIWGCYAGLDNYIGSAPGCLRIYYHGRGLLAAAAYYHDDPEYRWFVKDLAWHSGPWNSVATMMLPMHYDPLGEVQIPTRYDGAFALPFDPRLYDVVAHPESGGGWGRQYPVRLPGPLEQAVDRVAFRDGMTSDDAYLLLTTTQRLHDIMVGQNNAIARYTDLGDVWLFHNTMLSTGWARNVVSVSNGRSYVPATGCTLEALANLGEISAVASREHGVGGADWTRSVIHWRRHYFVVIDRITALEEDELNLVCRWRTPRPASLTNGVWTATAPTGNQLHVQPAPALQQTSEHWEMDGAARPYVLSQYQSVALAEGESATFRNLLYVSGNTRPDDFEVRPVGSRAVLVSGQADGAEHLALVGAGAPLALPGFETDAAIYHVTADRLVLAEATTLECRPGKARGQGASGAPETIFKAERPVNLLVDFYTGAAEVEVRGDVAVPIGFGEGLRASAEAQPGRTTIELAQPAALPDVRRSLRQLWQASRPPRQRVPQAGGKEGRFRSVAADAILERPLGRVEQVSFAGSPETQQPLEFLGDDQYGAWLPGHYPTWWQGDGVELRVSLPEPARLSHLRLVSTMRPERGTGLYQAGDLEFSLVLSNDGFERDVRRVENAEVTFEETDIYPIYHHDIGRLPTFRIDIRDTVKDIRIIPASVDPDKPFVSFQGLELYTADRVEDLAARAFAADVNGDGSNELVVGTSDRQVAAYDVKGRQLWSVRVPGAIFTMGCADLDEDGRQEALVYTMMETLHCIDGDGAERYRADVNQALRAKMGDEWVDNNSAAGGLLAMGVWGPEDIRRKEVVMPGEVSYRVKADGSAEAFDIFRDWGWKAATRVANLYPGEPEVLAGIGPALVVFSPRKDEDGNYVRLSYKRAAGPAGAPLMHAFGWVRPIGTPGHQGLLAANETSVNWCPIEYLASEAETGGWGFTTGGVPIVAVLAEDVTGDGVPEVLAARQDGFINVLSLSDGAELGLLNTGEPVLGMAMLQTAGERCLAVGTKFGVHMFGGDLAPLGRTPISCVAFAGPGGEVDSVYTVNAAGEVTVLTLR